MIINLPKLGPVRFRDDLSTDQINAQVGQLSKKYGFAIPKPEMGLGEIAGRGFSRGLGELGIATTDTIPALVGSSLGFDKYAQQQMQEAQEARAKLEAEAPTRFKSYKDVEGFGEGAEFVAETLGELGPTALGALVPGVGAGAIGSRLAASTALKQAAAKQLPEIAAKELAKRAGQQAGKRAMYGGVFFGSAAQNIPEVFEGIYRETDKFEPGLAALAGGLSSVLDSIVPGQVLGQLGVFGRQKAIAEMAKNSGAAPKVWKTLTAAAVKAAGTEGLTESAQEAIGATAERIAGSLKGVFHPENVDRYKEAFVKGAIGGGAFGVVGGAGQQVGIGQERAQRLQDIREQRGARDQARADERTVEEFVNQPQEPVGVPIPEAEAPMTQEQAEERFGGAFATLPELQNRQEQIASIQAQQAQEEPGSARFNAFQGNIDAIQEGITRDFGRQTVTPPETLKVTPEVIKSLGIHPKNKFSKFIEGMDLSHPLTLNKLIRTIEAPLDTDPRFEGNAQVENAYNKLISAAPADVVQQIRDRLKPAVQTEAPIDLAQGVEPEVHMFDDFGEIIEEPTVRRPQQAQAPVTPQPRVEEQTPTPLQEQAATEPTARMQNLDFLSEADPTNPEDVAEVLRFGEDNADKRVQKQLNLWASLNVPKEVMQNALSMTADPIEAAEPSVVKEQVPIAQTPQQPVVEEQVAQDPITQQPTDPVQSLLGKEDYRKGTPEKDAHTYFSNYVPEEGDKPFDPSLALMSVAHDLVNQPTVYKGDPRFEGQGGKHAKNAEKWIRANMATKHVKELDRNIKIIRELETKADKTRTVVDNTLPKPEKKKEEKPRTSTEERREKSGKLIDDVLKTTLRDYDIGKGNRGLKADQEAAALQKEAHKSVHKELKDGNLTRALNRLASTGSSNMVKNIARKLQPHLGNTKIKYSAKESSFDPSTNTINLRDNPTEYEVLHEATHAAVSHVVANKHHIVTKQLQKLFERVKSNIDPVYGTQNLQEFVAEVWSNNDFRNQLDNIRDTTRTNMSLWDSIIDTLRRFFGLGSRKDPSILDEVDSLLNEIVSTPPDTRTGESLYAQSINDPKFIKGIHEKVNKIMADAPLMNEERATAFWGSLEKLTTQGKALAYRALNLSALGQVAKKVFGGTGIKFSDVTNSMSGYQEGLQERGYPLHRRLQIFAKDARYQEWSTLVHDSTVENINPEAPQNKYKANPEQFKAWTGLHTRFNKMTPEMKQLYRYLFSAHKTLNDETLKSLEGNIDAAIPDKELAKSTYKKLLTELANVNVEHYAPLFRRGIYRLDYTAKDGDRVAEFFTTQAERSLAAKRAKGKGGKDFDEYTTSDNMGIHNIPSGTVLSSLVKIMQDSGVGEKAIEQVANLVAKAMPETSMWKHRMKREGISGYIDDAALAYDNVTSATMHQLSRLKYSGELNRLIADMVEKTNTLRGPDQERARLLLEEFKRRHEFILNPNISDFAQLASTGSFFYFLAGNVSSAIVNMLQLPLVVGPQLWGEYGIVNGTKALMKAMQLYTQGGFRRKVVDLAGNEVEQNAMWSLENGVSHGAAQQYKGLLDKLKEYGFLQTSTARDAAISANNPTSTYGGVTRLHYLSNLAGTFMFHHAERMNREVTAIAAYDLEKSKLAGNKNLSREEIEAQAIDKAIRAVETMHGAGHTLTGPSLGHSDLGKVLMVFKRFAFSMYYMLFDTMRRALPTKGATGEQLEAIKMARRQLAGIYGMSFLFAGAKGLPLYWVGEMAYNAFVDDDEDDFDTVMRKFLGDMPYKGPVNHFLNLSIADRVGWSDLIYREGKSSKADASALSSFVESIFGAPYAIANNMFRASDLIEEGNYERALETALPIAMRNALKGPRYSIEGVNTLRGDPVMGEVSGYNAMMQTLGFAPADLSVRYMDIEHAKKKESVLLKTQDRLTKQYYMADREGDFERADELKDKLFEFGDKHPELNISEESLKRSVKARDRISDELYNGVHLSKKLKDSLVADIEEFK